MRACVCVRVCVCACVRACLRACVCAGVRCVGVRVRACLRVCMYVWCERTCLFSSVDLFSHYVAITFPLREETVFWESTGVSVSDIY